LSPLISGKKNGDIMDQRFRLVSIVALVAMIAGSASAGTAQISGSVSVLAVWGGDERESFLAMVKPFEERTGVRVRYEGTRDLNAVLTTRVQAGNPPDVAILPGPGQMAELARRGRIVALDRVLDMPALREEYAREWIALGSAGDRLYGIFVKTALKGLIWYNPRTFRAAGYTVPTTWSALMALTDRIAETGTAPWCIGLESGAASGWPATDWIEDLLLRSAGPHLYDQWVRHEIPWTHPAVKGAWEMFGRLATNRKYALGGQQGVLSTNFGESPYPIFASPPRCYMHHQATFIQGFIQKQFPRLSPGEDLDFFAMPAVDARYAGAVIAAGDLAVMFRGTPQSRALLQWLANGQALAIWVRRGGALSPNKKVPASVYPDALSGKAGGIIGSARIVRFDGSDLMPEAVSNAFWKGTLDYVNDPGGIDTILGRIERIAGEAYRR